MKQRQRPGRRSQAIAVADGRDRRQIHELQMTCCYGLLHTDYGVHYPSRR